MQPATQHKVPFQQGAAIPENLKNVVFGHTPKLKGTDPHDKKTQQLGGVPKCLFQIRWRGVGLSGILSRVPKWCKVIIAVLLLPVCAGGGATLWRILRLMADADTIWVAFLAGAGCWVVIYLILPKPMWVYVFGHELTHAIWTWMLGGGVKKFKVTSKGGHVVVTKSNFLIALAPYFFPLYAVIVMLVYFIARSIWDVHHYVVWFHLLLGAAYAFHVTLTWYVLQSSQTDITSQGYLFSAVVVFLGNVTVLLIGIPLLVARVNVFTAFGWWFDSTREVVHRLAALV